MTYELVVDYQAALHEYRKVDGTRLSVATQVQRLVPGPSSSPGCVESIGSM